MRRIVGERDPNLPAFTEAHSVNEAEGMETYFDEISESVLFDIEERQTVYLMLEQLFERLVYALC